MEHEPQTSWLEEVMTNLERSQAHLAQAQADLVQKQAGFKEHCRAMDRERAKLDRESAERFARIEVCCNRILVLLLRNEQLLKALPDVICEKLASDMPVIVEQVP
jgi:hypothetical protein